MEIIRNSLQIGLEKPVKALHLTDCHLNYIDDRDSDDKKRVWAALKHLDKDEDGHIARNFDDLITYGNVNCDITCIGGDNIAITTQMVFEKGREAMARSKNALFVVGNHEFSQLCGESWEGTAYKMNSYPQVRKAFGEQTFFASRVVGGVNFVGIDDSYYLIEDWQTERLKKEVEKGYPIVLFMHVPLFEQKLYDFMMQVTDGLCTYLTGCDEEHLLPFSEFRAIQQRPDAATLRFIDYLYSQDKVKAILAGHVHQNFVSELPNGIMQFVTHGGYAGYGREITLY